MEPATLALAFLLPFAAGAFTQWLFDKPRYRARGHRAKG